jgi:hypothetical protein
MIRLSGSANERGAGLRDNCAIVSPKRATQVSASEMSIAQSLFNPDAVLSGRHNATP